MSLPVVEQPLTALGAIGGEGLRGITGAVQQMQQPLMQGAQRGMLGRALQDIAQQPQMTPLSQMAALSRVSDPQTAMAFQPFLQSERARFAAQQRLEKPPSQTCLLYTSPSPRDRTRSRMPSSA